MMVCGPKEKFLRKTLDNLKELCDDVIVCGNNIDIESKLIIKSYGYWLYEDNREWGIYQPKIKGDLLRKVANLNPDWIIALDADECFAPSFTREVAEDYAKRGEVAWYFLCINFFNNEKQYAHGKGIQRFWNIRFFKNLPNVGYDYLGKSLHCGLAPPFFYNYGWYAPYYFEHRGLMLKEDRERKAERYKKYDPTAKFKDKSYYEDLEKEEDEIKVYNFEPEKLLRQLSEGVDCKPRKLPESIKKYDLPLR